MILLHVFHTVQQLGESYGVTVPHTSCPAHALLWVLAQNMATVQLENQGQKNCMLAYKVFDEAQAAPWRPGLHTCRI